jgi:hypothetical protein
LNKVLAYTRLLASGQNTLVQANDLVDAGATFVADGVQVGDIVANTTTNQTAFVGGVSANEITLIDAAGNAADIFPALFQNYAIYDESIVNEAEKVTQSKITMLNNSMLTAPSTLFPAYIQQEPLLTLFPASINTMGAVQCQYIRYPNDPKWTYVNLVGGEPSFDQSQPDFQDFELSISDEPTLVVKILQYAGMSIREVAAVQFGQALEKGEEEQEK